MPRLAKVPPPPPPGCVWTPEAARLMGVSVKTLWNYRHLGKGPKPRVRGRKLAYPIDEINAWLDAQDEAENDRDSDCNSRPPEPRRMPRKPATSRSATPVAA